ncbi:hypothetical protein ACYSNU_09145 [Enterococcus sp. LJL120]
MKYRDFKNLLEENLKSYSLALEKVSDYEEAKNKKRTGKNKWPQKKVDKAKETTWDSICKNLYESVKSKVNSKPLFPEKEWLDYIEKHNFYENVDDMLAELEFE